MGRALAFVVALSLTAGGGLALWRGAERPASPGEEAGIRSTAPGVSERPDAAAADLPPVAPEEQTPAVAEVRLEPEIVPRASRDVTPPGVTPGPAVTGPLVRIPPPPEPEVEERPPKPRIERLFRPVVDSAGSLSTAAGRLRLADVDAPQPDATCGEAPEAWPCGRIARAELRRFIRSRAVECQVPPGADSLPETVRCSVAGSDIGEWLVRQGWARPTGEAYAEAARAAEAERRGLWGDGPR